MYQKSAIFKRSHLFQTIAGTIWCKPWDVHPCTFGGTRKSQNNLHNETLILSSRMNVFNTKFFDTNSEWTSRWCKRKTTDYPHVIQRHRKCIKHLQPIFGYPMLLFGGVWLWGFASFTQSLADSSNQWESHMLFYLLLELETMATPWLQNGPWRCIFPWTSGFFQTSSHAGVPSGKLTWQWKITLLKMYSLLKMGIFHCYVSLPEGTCFRILSWTFTMSATTSCWYHRAQWAHGFSRWTTC